MERTIKIRSCVSYPVPLVWQAITNSKWLGKWFMENDLQPIPDHEFTFRMAPQKGWDGITYCKVIEMEPLQKIVYSYCGKATGEKTLACANIHSDLADKVGKGIFTELDTVLSFTITPTCGGSCITLEHSGFKGIKLMVVSFVMAMGWRKQLNKRLPKIMEQMSNEDTLK